MIAAGVALAATGPVLTTKVVQTSVWDTGYGADVVLTNGGDVVTSSWVVEFDLPSFTSARHRENHVSRILGRLALRDRLQAALYAHDHGII